MGKEIIYSFSEFDQKDDQTWTSIKVFVQVWNKSHKSQFAKGEELEITFKKLEDPELQELLEILVHK